MATLKTIAREQLLEPVVMRLRRLYTAAYKSRGGYYRAIKLTPSEIRDGSYKQYLGGGRDAWELRGAFQLFFLKQMGLQPFHKFLDVGCGPLRGGAHLIGYLDQGQYFGVDYNRDFIQAARQIAEDKKLSHKKPTLQTFCDFNFASVGSDFVFALAFSVLNHCPRSQRKRFFEQVPACLERNARLYITHARWFDDAALSDAPLLQTNRFKGPTDICETLNMADWGWPERNAGLFPILELTKI